MSIEKEIVICGFSELEVIDYGQYVLFKQSGRSISIPSELFFLFAQTVNEINKRKVESLILSLKDIVEDE